MQRDLYLDAVNHALESSTTLLQLAVADTQQAMRPLQARAGNGSAADMSAGRLAGEAVRSAPPAGRATRSRSRSGRAAAHSGAAVADPGSS